MKGNNSEQKAFSEAIASLHLKSVEYFVYTRKLTISCQRLNAFIIYNGDLQNERFYLVLDMLLEAVDNINAYLYSCQSTILYGELMKQKYSNRIIRKLLIHGAKLNCKTEIFRVMMYIDLDTLIEIFSYGGADITTRDEHGDTVLHHIPYIDEQTEENLTKIVDLYLAAGGNINAQNTFGNTPLFRACASHSHNCLKILLDHGADVNTMDCERNTFLHRANMFKSPHQNRILDLTSDATIAKTRILTFRPEEEDFLLKLMIRGVNLSNQKNVIAFSDFYQRVFHVNYLDGPIDIDIIPYLSPSRKASINTLAKLRSIPDNLVHILPIELLFVLCNHL